MTDKEIIADLIKSGKYELERDGWSQLKPEYFIECGFPQSFIDPLITTFVSDGTWKGSHYGKMKIKELSHLTN